MKRVLLYIIVMLAVFLAFELLLMTRSNEYAYKRKYMDDHLDGIKVLFLGHSYFECGINPALIGDSVFNAAISGRAAGNTWDAQLAERYVPRMRNLRYLVLPFAYHHIYHNPNPSQKSKPSHQVVMVARTYICMNYKYMGLTSGPFSFLYWPELLNSSLDYMGRFVETDFKKLNSCDSTGYVKRAAAYKAEDWEHQKLPAYDPTNDRSMTGNFIRDFRDMADVCKQNGVELVIIATPVYETYRKEITAKWRADGDYVIDQIQKDNPHVRFYNMAFDPRFQADDFSDAGHLNDNGARKLSRIIKNILCDGHERDYREL